MCTGLLMPWKTRLFQRKSKRLGLCSFADLTQRGKPPPTAQVIDDEIAKLSQSNGASKQILGISWNDPIYLTDLRQSSSIEEIVQIWRSRFFRVNLSNPFGSFHAFIIFISRSYLQEYRLQPQLRLEPSSSEFNVCRSYLAQFWVQHSYQSSTSFRVRLSGDLGIVFYRECYILLGPYSKSKFHCEGGIGSKNQAPTRNILKRTVWC